MTRREPWPLWWWRCGRRKDHEHAALMHREPRVIRCATCGRSHEFERPNRWDALSLAALLALVVTVAETGVVTWQTLAILGVEIYARVMSWLTTRRRRRERGVP